MIRFSLLVAGAVTSACATVALTSEGARVPVYQAPLDGTQAQREMPAGCTLISTREPVSMTEQEIVGQSDPYRLQRNQAAATGANTILVLKQVTQSRRDPNCPASSPITDCPNSAGAWYKVVVENYMCTEQALNILSPPPAPRPTGSSVP